MVEQKRIRVKEQEIVFKSEMMKRFKKNKG
jgi:hypothetical protein